MANAQECAGGEKLIFACSGAADVGAISDRAARRMTRDGVGKMFCLAGVGGQVEGIVNKTKAASKVLAIASTVAPDVPAMAHAARTLATLCRPASLRSRAAHTSCSRSPSRQTRRSCRRNAPSGTGSTRLKPRRRARMGNRTYS